MEVGSLHDIVVEFIEKVGEEITVFGHGVFWKVI